MTTPFYPDGAVYYKKIEHNVDRYSRTPISGLVALGSTGEAVMLSDEERREVLRITAEVAAPEKVLIAGTGAESVQETLRLTEYAAKLMYDVALVRTPHFYRTQMKPEAMLAFYRTVADQSPLPVLLYTVPLFTAYDLPLEVVCALAEHPNIVGIKESSGGNGNQLVTVGGTGGGEAATQTVAKPKFKTRTKEVGFQVLVGAAPTILASFQTGASGAVLALAAPAPTICFEIYAAWKDNDLELARAKQESISAASKRVVSELGIPAVKCAMDINGYYGGNPRLPLLPLTAAQKSEVELVMASCRN